MQTFNLGPTSDSVNVIILRTKYNTVAYVTYQQLTCWQVGLAIDIQQRMNVSSLFPLRVSL